MVVILDVLVNGDSIIPSFLPLASIVKIYPLSTLLTNFTCLPLLPDPVVHIRSPIYTSFKFDTSIPIGIGGRPNGSETAKELRNRVFQVTETNSHPSLKAHEYRSTIIEDWLRHL